ncbi:hypothetical protein ELQ90_09870 [Labedella phragmitis]|uniref:SbsA Ig-like domain-containing protein n=1 Tax=Labedella phragmitis TaxID=2498849 RepID=A0A444PT89_9MICO|nr:hypothetical protein [Labedella phragmitis]RWZ51090.1 hypothetical protein ELQ90_09870 [Labedella phragmitis]
MSTERAAGPPAGGRAQRSAARRRSAFRRTLAATLGALLVIAVGAGAVGLLQGPQLARADIDVSSTVADSGARLILYADRPVREVSPDDVAITPDVPVTVQTEGTAILIRFDAVLAYDTTYEVAIAGVRSPGSAPVSDFAYTFTTGEPPLYILERDDTGDDHIRRTDISGDEGESVFSAPRIQQFEVVGEELVVATITDEDHSRLLSVPLSGGEPTEIPLPGDGRVEQLQSSARQFLVGFLYSQDAGTETSIESGLFVLQIKTDEPPKRVEATGSEETNVTQWSFVPSTTSVLVRTFADELVVADALTPGDPVLLGDALFIHGFVVDEQTAIIERTDAIVEVDLLTGEESPFPVPPDLTGNPGELASLSATGYARIYSQYDPATNSLSQSVEVVGNGTSRQLYGVDDGGTSILQVCASPNGQYIAVVEARDRAELGSDLYPILPMPRGVSTLVIDRESAEVEATIPGFDLPWCARPPTD